MLLAQGLGTPSIIIAPVFAAMIAAISIALYFLIRWLGSPDKKSRLCYFSTILAFWIFYQIAFPPFVSSDALTTAATTGAPSSRLIEEVGPPHATSEISRAEIMWYYQTGWFANRTIGITINRLDGKVTDWYVQ